MKDRQQQRGPAHEQPRSLNYDAQKNPDSLSDVPQKPNADVQRKEEDEVDKVQAKLDGGGQSLGGETKGNMEKALGADLSGVKVHTGSKGNEVARQQNARAVTVGQDIAFASGEYAPGTMEGDALLAHELAHTEQQKDAAAVQKKEKGGGNENAFEQDADDVAVGATGKLWGKTESWASGMGGKTKAGMKSGLKLRACGGGGTKPKEDSVKDSLAKDSLKAAQGDMTGLLAKKDNELTYDQWKIKYAAKMNEIKDVVGEQDWARELQERQLAVSGLEDEIKRVAKRIQKLDTELKGMYKKEKYDGITDYNQLLAAPSKLTDDQLTKLTKGFQQDIKDYEGLSKNLVAELKNMNASIGKLQKSRKAVLDQSFKTDHKTKADKFNAAYLSEGVKVILDKISGLYKVNLAPTDLRAISGQEQRDVPNPTAKSSRGAVGIGQITDLGLEGAVNWVKNQKWTSDEKAKLVFFDANGASISHTTLRPSREDTSKAPQLMAAALAATVNQLNAKGNLKPDKLTNLEMKMLIFGAYNAGAAGLSSHITNTKYRWQDINTGLVSETRQYVGGVLARLPISELQGAEYLDLSYAFAQITNKRAEKGTVGASLVSLPVEYTTLTSLKKLDLTGNKFTSLPAEMKNLKNLKELVLTDNLVSDSEIAGLKKALPNLKVTK